MSGKYIITFDLDKLSYNNKLKKYWFVLYKSYAWFSVFILGKYLWNHVLPHFAFPGKFSLNIPSHFSNMF